MLAVLFAMFFGMGDPQPQSGGGGQAAQPS